MRFKKTPDQFLIQGFGIKSLAMTYFRIGRSTLSSARSGFTSEFEMGSGGSRSLSSPGNLTCITHRHDFRHNNKLFFNLVSKSTYLLSICIASINYKTTWVLYDQASRSISTGQLHALLHFHLQPINVVVFNKPSGALRLERSHLRAGFPLRCFQRLSLPNIATRLCHWRDNRYTRGSFTPVLSY